MTEIKKCGTIKIVIMILEGWSFVMKKVIFLFSMLLLLKPLNAEGGLLASSKQVVACSAKSPTFWALIAGLLGAYYAIDEYRMKQAYEGRLPVLNDPKLLNYCQEALKEVNPIAAAQLRIVKGDEDSSSPYHEISISDENYKNLPHAVALHEVGHKTDPYYEMLGRYTKYSLMPALTVLIAGHALKLTNSCAQRLKSLTAKFAIWGAGIYGTILLSGGVTELFEKARNALILQPRERTADDFSFRHLVKTEFGMKELDKWMNEFLGYHAQQMDIFKKWDGDLVQQEWSFNTLEKRFLYYYDKLSYLYFSPHPNYLERARRAHQFFAAAAQNKFSQFKVQADKLSETLNKGYVG